MSLTQIKHFGISDAVEDVNSMIVMRRGFGHLSISDYGRFGANAFISVGTYAIYVFFQISKKTSLLTFLSFIAHVFSSTRFLKYSLP